MGLAVEPFSYLIYRANTNVADTEVNFENIEQPHHEIGGLDTPKYSETKIWHILS